MPSDDATATSHDDLPLPPHPHHYYTDTTTVDTTDGTADANVRRENTRRPRGPSLVQEAEETAAEVTATLATYHASTTASTHHMPLVRPSSATSSLATEYYGRPLPTATASRTAEAEAAPAADRLYADYFRKQAMLEEQRRIRDLELQLAMQQAYCTPVSRALAAHRTAGGYASYNERLYAEGRLGAMRREQEAAQIRAAEEEAKFAEATFHPQISKLAMGLKAAAARASGSGYGSGGGGAAAPWERLHNQGAAQKKERRAEAIRKELQEEELKECSFKPRVNQNSAKMVQQMRGVALGGGLRLHERLYNEGIFTKERQQETAAAWLPDEATFKPKINTSSVVMQDLMAASSSSLGGSQDSTTKRNVADRLLQRGRKYEERLEAAREASAAPVDACGRPLFQPRMLQAPKSVHVNDRAGPIGEHLYSAALESSARAVAHADAARQKAHADAGSVHVNSLSIKMMDRLKKERLSAIFVYLSSRSGPYEAPPREIDLLGLLRDEAFLDTIDPEVRADVEHAARLLKKTLLRRGGGGEDHHTSEAGVVENPFFEEDQENGGGGDGWTSHPDHHPPLSARSAASTAPSSIGPAPPQREALWGSSRSGEVTEAGFIALMLEVLHRTRGIARQYLMPLPPTRKKWDDPTFKPAVDPRSLAMAARTRPDGLPAHELLYRTAQETEEKKEVMRRERDAATMQKCSFKPVLVAAPMATEGRALKMAAQPPPPRPTPKTEQQQDAEAAATLEVEKEQQRQMRRKRAEARAAGAAQNNHQHRNNSHTASNEEQRKEYDAAVATMPSQFSSVTPLAENNGNHTRNKSISAAAKIPGESLEDGIEAIERQIHEAMARLSMTGENFAVQNKVQQQVKNQNIASVAASTVSGTVTADLMAARLRASLDYSALFGNGGDAAGCGVGDSSDFNPLLQQQQVHDGCTAPLMEESLTEANPRNSASQQHQQLPRMSLLHQLAAMPMPLESAGDGEGSGSCC